MEQQTDQRHKHHIVLIDSFLKHRVASNLLLALMVVIGVWAIVHLNIQYLPNLKLNIVTVNAAWPGSSPQDVEQLITTPIETELKNLDNLKQMTSTSKFGSSKITLEFIQGANMTKALEDVKQRVDLVRDLPKDLQYLNTNLEEHLELIANALVYTTGQLSDLRSYIYAMRDDLLAKGISKVEIVGLPDQELAIQVPSINIAELRKNLNDIAAAVAAHSKDLPAGTIGSSEIRRQLRSLDQKRSVGDFEQLALVSSDNGRLIRVADIADVQLRAKLGETLVEYKGHPAVVLQLYRTEHGNTLKSAKILKQWIAEKQLTLPPSIQIKFFDERWQGLKGRINLLLSNGASGLILILIVLFLFLHRKVAFWVSMGIPVSFMAAFGVLYVIGGSINMISLFAFIMTLGIIVDDSIVVGEETLTQLQKGQSPIRAAYLGVHTMFYPVLASALTTICAFLPLLMVGDNIGVVLRDIPIVVICIIVAALIECLLVLPRHLYDSFKNHTYTEMSGIHLKVHHGFENFKNNVYRKWVLIAVKHREITVAMALSIFLLALGLVISGRLPFTFFPSPNIPIVNVNMEFNAGTTSPHIYSYLTKVEQAINKTNLQLSKNGHDVVLTAAVYQNQINGEQSSTTGDNLASVTIELQPIEESHITNGQFVNQLRKNLPPDPEIEHLGISSRKVGVPGSDIAIRLVGSDPQKLKNAAMELKQVLQRFVGASNVKDDLPYGQEEIIFTLSPEGLALGLSMENVGSQVRSAFRGNLAQIYSLPNEEIEVRVILPDVQRDSLSTLEHFPIITPNGSVVPLRSVVDLKNARGWHVLRHDSGRLTTLVSASIDSSIANINEISDEVKQNTLPKLKQNYQVDYSFEGRMRDQDNTLTEMFFGLILALVLIYVVLAWIFSSYGWPFIIMTAIPLGVTGAIFGHWIMGIDLTILSLFGLFGLTGIVVNDSLILMSKFRNLIDDGVPTQQAIVEAGCQRLRAVFLTTSTTVAGLFPLMFETSVHAQFLIPMAVSIVFGLTFSTVLILLVIPALLSYYASLHEWIDHRYHR